MDSSGDGTINKEAGVLAGFQDGQPTPPINKALPRAHENPLVSLNKAGC